MTPEKTPPTRRLALLEARLIANGGQTPAVTPVTPAAPSGTPLGTSSSGGTREDDGKVMTTPTKFVGATAIAATASSSYPPLPTDNSDSVRSFSSDGTQGRRPAPVLSSSAAAAAVQTTNNSRRKYAPPPRGKGAVRKRKRLSQTVMRNTRVDQFFKPVAPNPKAASNSKLALITSPSDSPKQGNSRVQSKNVDPISPDVHEEPPTTVLSSTPAAVADNDTMNSAMLSGDYARTPERHSAEELDSVVDCADGYRHMRALIDRLTIENSQLRKEAALVEDLRAENEDLRTQVELELPELREALCEKEHAVENAEAEVAALRRAATEAAVRAEKLRREIAERALFEDGERIGHAVVERSGMGAGVTEVWQDGREWQQVDLEIKNLQGERDAVERRRRDVARRKRRDGTANVDGDVSCVLRDVAMKAGVSYEESAEYAGEVDEICRVRLQSIKRLESSLLERKSKLNRERDLLIREVRRQNDEKQSRFGDCRTLKDRYVLLNMLGRGGFSEVFKALDLKEGIHVACKIHQLANNWSEEKKRNFIKHAMREYEIHKSLKHPRVVRLVDIFEIDESCFCTVLEYCDGCDLDSYLRQHRVLAEKEARCIITQVLSGLLYLAEQKRRIIHYDLKPGNILLRKGEVQITDFGLSKIMGESQTTRDGMELTSQGAGTMWYLPPECFETGGDARISSKVDVWSAGVILFQMLYGKKPFGHDQSQERMFREKTVQKEILKFPAKPAVTDVAKEFIGLCLTRNPNTRPDAKQLLLHPFIRRK